MCASDRKTWKEKKQSEKTNVSVHAFKSSLKCWFWARKCPFYSILGIARFFSRKGHRHLFSVYWALTSSKKSLKKVISQPWEKGCTDGRTELGLQESVGMWRDFLHVFFHKNLADVYEGLQLLFSNILDTDDLL